MQVFTHHLLPFEERDNELVKIALCNKLKHNIYHSKSKTTNSSVFSLHKILPQPQFTPSQALPKRFKVRSCQKEIISKITFNSLETSQAFPLYKDAEVGFNASYKVLLKGAESDDEDEDIETDEEQLQLAEEKCLETLLEDLTQFKPKQLAKKKNAAMVKQFKQRMKR